MPLQHAHPAGGGAPATASAPTRSAPAPGASPAAPQYALTQHCFSDEAHDTALHFQVVDLGRQLYVWVGGAGGALGSLTLAAAPAGAGAGAAGAGTAAAALPNGPSPAGAAAVGMQSGAAPSGDPAAPVSASAAAALGLSPSREAPSAARSGRPAVLPPATMLLRGGGGGAAEYGAGASLARRLALRLGRPVAVAWALPGGAPEVAAAAEARLLRELATLRL
jgi:hypothetical protein